MENQGKRLLLAVSLALGVMLLWNMFLSPKKGTSRRIPWPAMGRDRDACVLPSRRRRHDDSVAPAARCAGHAR